MASSLVHEANSPSPPKLHLVTYLCPDFPLELFQTYQHYLEQVLSCDSYLVVESRWGAPPTGKNDPFTANEMDIGKTSRDELELHVRRRCDRDIFDVHL